jgi:hypothetical protein
MKLTELQRTAVKLAEHEFSVSGAFWAPLIVGLTVAAICAAWKVCTHGS